jgi:hypothetical protein
MVLSAKDLGITDESLEPCFCCKCGNRIGWARDLDDVVVVYCEDCAKTEPEDEDV